VDDVQNNERLVRTRRRIVLRYIRMHHPLRTTASSAAAAAAAAASAAISSAGGGSSGKDHQHAHHRSYYSSSTSGGSGMSPRTVLTHLIAAAAAFQLGFVFGGHHAITTTGTVSAAYDTPGGGGGLLGVGLSGNDDDDDAAAFVPPPQCSSDCLRSLRELRQVRRRREGDRKEEARRKKSATGRLTTTTTTTRERNRQLDADTSAAKPVDAAVGSDDEEEDDEDSEEDGDGADEDGADDEDEGGDDSDEDDSDEQQQELPRHPSPQRGQSVRIPDTVRHLFAGMGLVNRDDFAEKFDIGVPVDATSDGNQDVMLLYTSEWSLPDVTQARLQRRRDEAGDGGGDAAEDFLATYESPELATENCRVVKILLTEPHDKPHCIAIMGQWESYHLYKYERFPSDEAVAAFKKLFPLQRPNLDPTKNDPLRPVPRGWLDMRNHEKAMPGVALSNNFARTHLVNYFTAFKETKERLKPIAQRVAGGNSGAIIVMVVNFGQSGLFTNFVCHARSSGDIDLSKVLLFATDKKTVELAEALQVNVFDVGDAFGSMPEEAASRYGDNKFTGTTIVICRLRILGA